MANSPSTRHGYGPAHTNRDEKFVVSPNDPPRKYPEDCKGGPGVYDGETGYPERTPSPNAAPEKIIDGNLKGQTNIPPEGDEYD